MAIKTGFSHSMATLLLTILSALLIYFLRDVGIFERIFDYLTGVSYRVSIWFERIFHVSISYEIFPIIFVAAVLAFLWGVIYHISRRN